MHRRAVACRLFSRLCGVRKLLSELLSLPDGPPRDLQPCVASVVLIERGVSVVLIERSVAEVDSVSQSAKILSH